MSVRMATFPVFPHLPNCTLEHVVRISHFGLSVFRSDLVIE